MYHDSFFCANLITCVQTEYDFVNEACQNSRDFYSVTAFNSISSVRDINPVDSDDALYHEHLIHLLQNSQDESSSDDEGMGYEQIWEKNGPPLEPPGSKPPAAPRRKFTPNDFSFHKVLGKGSFGKV